MTIICTTDELNGMVAEADHEGETCFELYVAVEGKMAICFYPKNCWMAIDHVPKIDPWGGRLPFAIITAVDDEEDL